MTNKTLRKFLFFKMPIAWLAGLRLVIQTDEKAIVSVKFGRFNQNPFKSMFWAVQGMAAELSTGILCMEKIQSSGKRVSMLVVEQNGKFFKKAVGQIKFTCDQGALIDDTIQKAIDTGDGQTISLDSMGINEEGVKVAHFTFVWSFKAKS